MIPRIISLEAVDGYKLNVSFDDGKKVCYDVLEDIESIPQFLKIKNDSFYSVKLDQSKTCVYWSDEIDLASDTIYEYGKCIH